ncbi:unnamed protein product [Bursaphelenchus okinawaensis]|uniref:WW domain-containing protein n=1 Tax=Bursaphelenchus okinawaensis TaxID=465554 RepID=A0A811L190_9BILA|nr:unnamed protein product [Bursaphelenchus okinawaensis]CAG9115148.1 unnamed protein product [Bursaphelenchus okinawaensis]
MPLPPALLARLQKRGIVKAQEKDDEEEVFAENYDSEDSVEDEEEEVDQSRGGAPGCPNKWNQYHLCSEYCFDHWHEGTPESRLSEDYLSAKERMLNKYPLPDNWKEVYDPGVARHYYWNHVTDEVCWLSPNHPCANVTKPAPQMAAEYFEAKQKALEIEEEQKEQRKQKSKGRWDRRREELKRSMPPSDEPEPESVEEMSDRDRLKRAKRKGIDPMDPSAYSDVPEGNWGAGLVEEANTGVDTSASGPLFQSRPYPSPGDILRRNKS